MITARRPPEPECSLRAHMQSVSSVRFLARGPEAGLGLASGDTGGQVKLWDLVLQRPVVEWAASGDGIVEIHEHAGGRQVLTQARDGYIKLWDLDRLLAGDQPDACLARSLHTDAFHFARCAVAPRGSTADDADYMILAPSGSFAAMTLWDSRCDAYSQKLAVDNDDAMGMCMSSRLWLGHNRDRPPLALLGYENGQILCWDLRHTRVHATATIFTSPVMGIDVSADGKRVFTAGIEPAARVCRLTDDAKLVPTGPPLPVVCDSTEHAKDGVGQLALRPDGKIFVTAGWDFRIRVFAAKPPHYRPLAVLRHHDDSVNALDFAPDSSLLAAGSKDSKVSLWRIFPPNEKNYEN